MRRYVQYKKSIYIYTGQLITVQSLAIKLTSYISLDLQYTGERSIILRQHSLLLNNSAHYEFSKFYYHTELE